ncbi:hypothetical protein AB1Y20_012649 [Prymnesium parvum]|uniref:Kinesin-like protein KIN-8B n=1 Tax=Prymnesium parvum TaxID=97485 RepID=A0AB34IL75_PRYPA
MAGESKSQNITVAVRVRPLTPREVQRGSWATVEVLDAQNVLVNDPDDKMGGIDYLRLDKTKSKHYCFDHAFGPDEVNEVIYEKTAKALARKVVDGFNACCFAYGATGAGKTFTMMGSLEFPGVIPLTLSDVFNFMEENREETTFQVSMQYVEIYNEKIKDLLNPSDAQLDVREVPSKGTYVAGATEKNVSTPAQMLALMHEGNLFRTTEATKVNEVSSRSHAVLQVMVAGSPRFSDDAIGKLGKLSMIDLAGSERATKTENKGQRLVEGRNINSSLLALGNCINALADKSKKASHVPFRDSKLTRLLKDSLGGNCLTTMIANCSPSHDQFDETLNSLKYANRAKNIKPRSGLPIVVNERNNAPLLSQLKELQEEVFEQAKRSEQQPTPLPMPRPRRTKASQAKRTPPRRGEASVEPEAADADDNDDNEEEEPGKRPPARRATGKSAKRSCGGGGGGGTGGMGGGTGGGTGGGGGGGGGAPSSCTPAGIRPREVASAEPAEEPPSLTGLSLTEPLPPEACRSRSPGMGARKWSQMGYGLSSMTAAITQPKALQMYQLLDNMELEECDTIKESAHALLDEHAGLLGDLYAATQQMFKLQSGLAACTSQRVERDRMELEELEEGREAQRKALEENLASLTVLITELPMRIISLERQEITRLMLQNVAISIMQVERELQLQTLRKLLLPSVAHTPPLHPSLLRDVMAACAVDFGGGKQLLTLAGGRDLPLQKTDEDAEADGAAADADAARREARRAAHLAREEGRGAGGSVGSCSSFKVSSLAAVVPTLIEAEEKAAEEATVDWLASARSPSFLTRHLRVGEIVHQAAALSMESARREGGHLGNPPSLPRVAEQREGFEDGAAEREAGATDPACPRPATNAEGPETTADSALRSGDATLELPLDRPFPPALPLGSRAAAPTMAAPPSSRSPRAVASTASSPRTPHALLAPTSEPAGCAAWSDPTRPVAEAWPESVHAVELSPIQLASAAVERVGLASSSAVGAACGCTSASQPSCSLMTKTPPGVEFSQERHGKSSAYFSERQRLRKGK